MELLDGRDPELQGYAGLALIIGVGLSTGFLSVMHAVQTPFWPGQAVYVLTPILVSGGLILAGISFWRFRFDGPGMIRIAGWMFVGMVVFGLLITWAITHEAVRGTTVTYSLFVTTNSVTIGALVGLMLGWFDVRNRRYKQQLKREQAKLKEQVDQLDEFASIVSHDLRNPLTVAKGQLSLAQADCNSDHLDEVTISHDRMEALIEDVLTMAREGTAAVDPEPVPLRAVVQDCWTTVRTPEATLELDLNQRVVADRSRLQQLLANLIRNSIDHSVGEVTVHVSDFEDGFYVADDGPGIPKSDRELLFDTGFTTEADGTGLGLNIVEQVVQAHGWDIHVAESAEGGARFEITGVESLDRSESTSTGTTASASG